MKTKLILTTICLLTMALAAPAQNRIKLFDPTSIGVSDLNVMLNSSPFGMYKSAEFYLSCPSGGRPTSSLSGADGGDLIVDNMLVLNGSNVCDGNCFTITKDPFAYIGMPVEMAYNGVAPINVGREITGSGLYTFNLLDFGYTFGSSAVYLNTTCSIIPIVAPPDPEPVPGDYVLCHRDNGVRGQKTLRVGPAAVSAHLDHGDTLGACAE